MSDNLKKLKTFFHFFWENNCLINLVIKTETCKLKTVNLEL
jgi:hypothetical protein